MLKRALLLCLGLWLIAASGLSAHAGPCDMREAAAVEIAAASDAHAHCDMMVPPTDDAAPEMPDTPDRDADCCCPAVLAAVPAPDAPEAAAPRFALMAALPSDISAPSRNLSPEPPPPKA
jgi:hypothetical protein